jgi:hypothetical protein
MGDLARLARLLTWPVRRLFEPQFRWTRDQVVQTDHRLHQKLDEVTDTLRNSVSSPIAEVRDQLERVDARMSVGALSGTEALAHVGHELRRLNEAVARLEEAVAALGAPAPSAPASSPTAPYAAQALGGLPRGARVLVAGGDAATAEALTGLGLEVTVAAPGAAWPVAGEVAAVVWTGPAGADGESVEALRAALGADGRLVLSMGAANGRGTGLGALLAGWRVEDLTVAAGPTALVTVRPPDSRA